MFKDSAVTRLDPWVLREEADAIPAVCYPAFVGSGQFGLGLDGGGLQSLPDTLGPHYNCYFTPYHRCQADLYVLHEGLHSRHLWDDESRLTGHAVDSQQVSRESQRNFMPFGYLTQEFEVEGAFPSGNDTHDTSTHHRIAGDDLRRHARFWRRDWDLRSATVCTSYDFGWHRRMRLSVTAFVPHGGETLYLRLHREPLAGCTARFTWSVRLAPQTRNGLPLFDPGELVPTGPHTLIGRTGPTATHAPVEPYALVYAAAADGLTVQVGANGWQAACSGAADQAQTAWLRLDFRLLAGDTLGTADALARQLEATSMVFDAATWRSALAQHTADSAAFWNRTADIETTPADERENVRRFMLHLSTYLSRCANDYGRGGSVQYLLVHQNGWRACNFHDHHYILDGLARANLWDEVLAHLEWLFRVMKPEGRPFPWMMTYDGYSPVPPGADRAPMSDANRALLAIRIYELAGRDRATLLRERVYPIVRRVAQHAVSDWFYREGDHWLFRAVETDVMNEEPRVSEPGTVVMYLAVLRKAVAYSAQLDCDAALRRVWEEILAGVRLATGDSRYLAWQDAAPAAATSTWFNNSPYIAEALPFLDREQFRRTRDAHERRTSCNRVWLNCASASTEIRLERPDRAEQFMTDSLEHGIHGPGYFEEVTPNGVSALPPFASAHGAYLTAACEQLVQTDFWEPRISVGLGLPSRMRTRSVCFRNLRARGGVLISGRADPRCLQVELRQEGEAQVLDVVLRVPCDCGVEIEVRRDGAPVAHDFGGDRVTVRVDLAAGTVTTLSVGDRGGQTRD